MDQNINFYFLVYIELFNINSHAGVLFSGYQSFLYKFKLFYEFFLKIVAPFLVNLNKLEFHFILLIKEDKTFDN